VPHCACVSDDSAPAALVHRPPHAGQSDPVPPNRCCRPSF
jgi:hypothetical protein